MRWLNSSKYFKRSMVQKQGWMPHYEDTINIMWFGL